MNYTVSIDNADVAINIIIKFVIWHLNNATSTF